MKFKIGDYVKIIRSFGLGGDVEGHIYKIIDTRYSYLLSIPEGTKHCDYDGTNAGWWYEERYLESALQPGEQMEFAFMYED